MSSLDKIIKVNPDVAQKIIPVYELYYQTRAGNRCYRRTSKYEFQLVLKLSSKGYDGDQGLISGKELLMRPILVV